jgi:hypothetical protein
MELPGVPHESHGSTYSHCREHASGLDSKIQVVPQGEVQLRGKTQKVHIFSVPVDRIG